MLKNYIVSALRSLKKKIGFTIVNILGLALGMTTCMVIFLFVSYDLSYDDFQDDNVYRMWINRVYPEREVNYPIVPHSFGPQLVRDFPEVEAQGRCFMPFDPSIVKYGDDSYSEDKIVLADSTFLDVFYLPLKSGDRETALDEINSVIVSESTAKRLFGDDEPIGKTIEIFGQSKVVSAVGYDYPNQSHFLYDYLIPLNQFPFFTQQNWVGFSALTYLKLKEGTNPADLESKFPAFVKQYAEGPIQQRNGISYDEYIKAGNGYNYHLRNIKDIHLYSHLENEMKANGNINYIYIFSIIAVFILIIACINFMNLSTARSTERGKEVGIRKVLGSGREQIMGQFLAESVIISFFASLAAIVLVFLVLPSFNELANRPLSIRQFLTPQTLSVIVALVIVIGLFAGIYPAFFISSFSPIAVLKGKLKGSRGSISLRNTLVVIQFGISITLISCTLIVFNQMNFMMNKPLGFKKENVIVIENVGALNNDPNGGLIRRETFKNEIANIPGVISGAYTSTMPGDLTGDFMISLPGTGQKESMVMRRMIFDDEIPETLNMEMLKGRFFSKDFEDTLSMVLNESAVIKLGLEDPIGKKILEIDRGDDPIEYTIIGVIGDFHFQSLHVDLKPAAFTSIRGPAQFVSKLVLKVSGDDVGKTLSLIEEKWNSFAPDSPFKSYFLDAFMRQFYESEKATSKIFSVFTFLAIVIACIGLLGLSAFVINQRIKEIGVRKVLGATVLQIITLLSKDFTKLIGIAAIIAIPLSYFWMNKWLESFAYSIKINLSVFVVSGIVALLIGLITISIQSIKAAFANPIDSLRDE